MAMETLHQAPNRSGELDEHVIFEMAQDVGWMNEQFNDVLTEESHDLLEQFDENETSTPRHLGAISLIRMGMPLSPEEKMNQIAMVQNDGKMPEDTEETHESLPSMHEYRAADAEKMILALLRGDESMLGAVPAHFRSALSTRMEQRIGELDSGEITEGFFREEIEKMKSVASIGMWANDFPVQWAAIDAARA